MAITGDVHIKVDSAVLRDKAASVSKSIASMSGSLEQLESIISRTSSYWIGEAGDMHRKIYMDQRPLLEEMMKRLKEHPTDLLAIAQTYDTVEAAVQEIASELPGDIIQ